MFWLATEDHDFDVRLTISKLKTIVIKFRKIYGAVGRTEG